MTGSHKVRNLIHTQKIVCHTQEVSLQKKNQSCQKMNDRIQTVFWNDVSIATVNEMEVNFLKIEKNSHTINI